MRHLITFILISIPLISGAQITESNKWVDSEVTYKDTSGNVVTITSSFPKGGGLFTDSARNIYSYVIFWYKISNESDDALELDIQFPAKPFNVFPSDDSFLRLFLPPDSMTTDKIDMFDYGLTGLKDFLETEFNEPSLLNVTINPKEDYLFYIPVLFYEARGSARSALVMNDRDLYFKISVNPDVQDEFIPCGTIIFKN